MAEEKKELVLHYVEDGDCRTCYANGAFGGMSPRGELVVNFFIDQLPLPAKEILAVEGGTPTRQVAREEKYEDDGGQLHTERHIVARVVMSLGVAQSVAQWLDGKVKEVMVRRDHGKQQGGL